MIKVYEFVGSTEEECRINCLEELDVYQNEIICNIEEQESKFVIKTVKKEEVENFIDSYIKELSEKMNFEIRYEINEEDDIYNVKMFSKNNPILIGKEGKNLKAIQTLLRQSIKNKTGLNIKINLDASNYKKKKEQYFERDIKKILNEVIINKDEIKLDSMNSYQRRLVHSIASDYYNIETESFGEEPNRYVVIRYVEK